MQPPRPWPKPPPRNHPDFNPDGLRSDFMPGRGGADLFFCHGLAAKSTPAKMMAAAAKGEAALLRALIEQHPECPPDFTNAHGITPLMVAAARGDTAVVNLLADHPLVSLSQQSRAGWTALHYAAWFDETETAALLLRRHAGFAQVNNFGETSFDFAQNKNTEQVFWAHKPFAFHMKRSMPSHPRFAKKPAAPAPEMTPAPAPQAQKDNAADNAAAGNIPLTTLFLRAALNVGLSTPAAEGVYDRLQGDIRAGRSDTLQDAYTRIEQAAEEAHARGQKINFDWDGLLGVAAAAGNIAALSFIAEKRDYMDSRPLTAALAALVDKAEDNAHTAEAAQWLLRWGADPNASGKMIGGGDTSGTIAYQAFVRGKPLIFESFCAQAGELKSWHMTASQLQWEQRVKKIIATQLEDKQAASLLALDAAGRAIALLEIRTQLRHVGHEKLTAHFEHGIACRNLCKTMAVYAETRTKRMLRGTFRLPSHLGAAAMVLALEKGRLGFARALEADGHSLKNLKDDGYAGSLALLEKNGGDDVKHFIAASKAGLKTTPDILSVDDKYVLLRAAAARMPVSGRGYGF